MEEKSNDIKIWNFGYHHNKSMFYVEKIIDDINGLTILLKDIDNNKLITIQFKEGVISYINTKENFLLNYWINIPKDILGYTFYITEKSQYIDFINKISLNVYKDWEIKHYLIYATEDCIDILSIVPPKISIENIIR